MKASGYAQEFRDFLLKQNALALAIGVIIGAAIGKVVTGLVNDIFMPLIGVLLPAGEELRKWEVPLRANNTLKIGDLLGNVVDFLIIALVIFVITKLFLGEKSKPATTRGCPECEEMIPLTAKRCRACASVVPPAPAS